MNDGSRDATTAIARAQAGVRVIDIPNGGLSAARNVGLAAASGEIVAYTDADVRVDPDWLNHPVHTLLTADVVGVGGPNVVPEDDPWIAQCVARAPGGPTHVLLDDTVAEHIPGCNMAFRRDALPSIGGFNPVFVRAGDDVDVCRRLQAGIAPWLRACGARLASPSEDDRRVLAPAGRLWGSRGLAPCAPSGEVPGWSHHVARTNLQSIPWRRSASVGVASTPVSGARRHFRRY